MDNTSITVIPGKSRAELILDPEMSPEEAFDKAAAELRKLYLSECARGCWYLVLGQTEE